MKGLFNENCTYIIVLIYLYTLARWMTKEAVQEKNSTFQFLDSQGKKVDYKSDQDT